MIAREDITAIGKFLKTHALKGELNAVFDIEADAISADIPLIVEIDGIFVPFYAEGIRGKGQFASLVKLEGVDTAEEARPFVNKTIYVLREDMAEIAGEEAAEGGYADDFIGFRVHDSELGDIGEIEGIDLSTQNALFLVKGEQGTVFIPVSEDFIDSIDEDNRVIHMSLPEGLIDLNT